MNIIKSLLLAVPLTLSAMASAEVAVIVNPANGNALTDKEISRIYLGKLKAFADGQAIEAINIASGNAARTEFEQKVLKKSSSQVKAYWSKLVFTGKGKPPKELASAAEVIKLVASTPNAIAYVDSAKLDGSVKVVKKF